MKDFFVTYNRADRPWAEWISWQLEDAGYSVVVQAWDFSGNWVLEMDRAMKETRRTVAVLSPGYLAALYTQPEWAEAFRRDPTGTKGILVPVRVEDVTVTGILAAITSVDFLNVDEPTAKQRLLSRVRGERGKPATEPPFPRGAATNAATTKPSFPRANAAPIELPGPASTAPSQDTAGQYHRPGLGWQSPVGRNSGRYKVVAFDLDGTLLRGESFAFSWERVWSELKFAKSVRRDLRGAYRLQSGGGPENRVAAYRNWCEQAVSHFRARALTRTRLQEMAAALTLTRNCRPALRALRDAGVVTAVISGGIHTFLEDCFPDFREFVDFAFVNEITFDQQGVVAGVRATPFDFEGKADALELVCRMAGCTRDETVFVGDQFNDEAVMLSASLAIAYPPGDSVVEDSARIAVRDDDLEKILSHILVD
jgi:HAD superfamily phosphoserine phosphatase-like hydrolase